VQASVFLREHLLKDRQWSSGYNPMRLAVYLLFMLAGVGVILAFSYRRWQQLIERERFLLGMKQASTPNKMCPSERSRLKVLRSSWWVVWRWLPDLWHRSPPL
jgi:hypothetical protein